MLFIIFYLAKTIKQPPDQTKAHDNRQQILWSAFDWVINKDVHIININTIHIDDISFIRSDEPKIHQVEKLTSLMLKTNNLEINKSKTEKYDINVKKINSKSWK